MPQPVKRLDEFLLSLREELRVLFLDVCRIRQHHGTQITCRSGRPDRLAVALRYEKRQPSGMIYVCMGKNDGIQLTDRDRKCSVLYGRLAPLALEHPAVERHCPAIDVQQVARARYFPGCTGKRYLQMSSALSDGA